MICLLRFYLRTLSILIWLRYRKVPDRALFDIPGSVMSPKVLPKDPRYPYSPEVPQGIRSRLFHIQGIQLCLLRLYLRTLSILINLRYRKVPDRALFDKQGIVLCLLTFYLRILSILIRHGYCKVQAIAFFNIQRIVICLLRFYLRILGILIRLRYARYKC